MELGVIERICVLLALKHELKTVRIKRTFFSSLHSSAFITPPLAKEVSAICCGCCSILYGGDSEIMYWWM